MNNEQKCALQRPVKRPWLPSNMVIKATGRHVCDNAECMADATVAFEHGNAVWMACAECQPDAVENVTKLARIADIAGKEEEK